MKKYKCANIFTVFILFFILGLLSVLMCSVASTLLWAADSKNLFPTITVAKNKAIYDLTLTPFKLRSTRFIFPRGGSYMIKLVENSTSSIANNVANKYLLSYRNSVVGQWQDYQDGKFPVNVKTGCAKGKEEVEFLHVGLEDTLEVKKITLEISYTDIPCPCQEDRPMNKCLIGEWVLDRSSFDAYMDKKLNNIISDRSDISDLGDRSDRSNRGRNSYLGSSGILKVLISEDKKVKASTKDFIVMMNEMKTKNTIIGEFLGVMEEGENGLICLTSEVNNLKIRDKIGSESILDLPELRQGSIDFIQYNCDAQTLQIRRADVNSKIILKRIFN
ncbi:MAG: hypothetical protein HQK49_07810 [Oligoflexia bacterium]|nr:hypothetical protein [Oligoflexia bacterium]